MVCRWVGGLARSRWPMAGASCFGLVKSVARRISLSAALEISRSSRVPISVLVGWADRLQRPGGTRASG